MQQVYQWSQGRLVGGYDTDGYGSQVITYTNTASEYNLGINQMYECTASADGYLDMISLAGEEDNSGDSSVSDSTGVKFFATTGNHDKFHITTNNKRHVLSIKLPSGVGGAGELRIVLKKPLSFR
jgi:hypothetical protein